MSSTTKPLILYVDDERPLLNALRRTLRSHPYELVTEDDPHRAVEFVRNNEVATVISDARMPGMSGVELLRQVAVIRPDATRILLTGYTDFPTTVSAINDAQVYRYLTKPWSAPELVHAISMGLEQRELRLSVREALRVAQQASEAKSEFVANVTHELRTPLHAILSFARLGKKRLSEGNLDRQNHYLDKVLMNGETLLHLVDDLLDFSKFDAGRQELHRRPESLVALVRKELSAVEGLTIERELNVRVDGDEAIEVFVDANQLSKAIRNLYGNAIKHSPRGGKLATLIEARKHTVEMTVEDEGPGVPHSELEAIFESFNQSKQHTGHGGTGLGLAIARSVVTAHGGTIRAERRDPTGLRMRVVLPTALEESGDPADRQYAALASAAGE